LLLSARERTGRTLAHAFEVAARPGRNELVLPLVGPSELRLRLIDGLTRIPWDDVLYTVEVRSLSSGERVEVEPPVCLVPEPGEYELRFGPFRGYRPVAPVRVWVTAGEVAEVEVLLVPAS
jgi:hypothetical protein